MEEPPTLQATPGLLSPCHGPVLVGKKKQPLGEMFLMPNKDGSYQNSSIAGTLGDVVNPGDCQVLWENYRLVREPCWITLVIQATSEFFSRRSLPWLLSSARTSLWDGGYEGENQSPESSRRHVVCVESVSASLLFFGEITLHLAVSEYVLVVLANTNTLNPKNGLFRGRN